MTLKQLQKKHLEGFNISFDISNHRNIPNAVLFDNSIAGKVSINTINSFNNWKLKL
jgi:hypothetical protein